MAVEDVLLSKTVLHRWFDGVVRCKSKTSGFPHLLKPREQVEAEWGAETMPSLKLKNSGFCHPSASVCLLRLSKYIGIFSPENGFNQLPFTPDVQYVYCGVPP